MYINNIILSQNLLIFNIKEIRKIIEKIGTYDILL